MADATAATGLGSIVPKPRASYLEEYERQMAARTNNAPTVFQQNYDTAAGRLASIASGTPSAGVQAAQQASREALARQAGNLRATTASASAASGQLGQGAGVRAAAANEQNIMKGIADSRLAERQAISQEASDANQQLISGAQADRSFDFQKQNQQQQLLGTLLDKGTASQQMEAQAGLQSLSGITPNPKADEINRAAYLEATGTPEYLAQQTTAKTTQMEAESLLQERQQEGKRKELMAQSRGEVVKGSNGYQVNGSAVPRKGNIVMWGGKPYIFENATKDTFVLKDPITNETIYLKD